MDSIHKNKSFNTITLVYFAVLPFVFLTSISDLFLLPRQLFTGIFLTVTLFFLIRNRNIPSFALDNTTFFFLGFITFCIISFSKSQIPDLSHDALAKYLLFLLFFILLRHLLVNDLIKTENLYTSIIVFGLLSITLTLLAFTSKTNEGQNLFRQVNRMSGTFGNKNLLSSVLFFCMPFYFIGTSMSRKIKTVSVIAIVTTTALLLILRTRTVLIALSIYLLLVLLLQIRNKVSKKTFYWSLSIPVTLMVISVIYLFSIKGNLHSSSDIKMQYFYRLLSSDTFYSRVEFWHQAGYIIKDNFFNGIGVGNWMNAYPNYGLSHFSNPAIQNGRMVVTNPHNDFLLVFSEIGIFGLLSYLGIFTTAIHHAYWLFRNEKTSTERKKSGYLLFFMFCYLIVAFFDFPLTRIEHQVILLTAIAIITAKYLKANPSKIKVAQKPIYLISFCFLFYAMTVTLFRINGEQHLLKATEAEKIKDHATAVFEFNNAKNSFFSTDNYAIPIDWHLGKSYYNQGSFGESLNYFTKAYQSNPNSIIVINDLGSAYAKNGNDQEAINHYKKALALSSNYEDARINLAATYYNVNDFKSAFETIDHCNVNTKSKLYKPTLTAVFEKKLNETLLKINNTALNNYMKSKIKTEEDLLNLYFDYKKNKLTFDEYILSLIN